MVDVGGVFLAVLSAIFNGTFGTLSKIKRVQDAEVDIQMPLNRVDVAISSFGGGAARVLQCTMACQSWHFDRFVAHCPQAPCQCARTWMYWD